MIKCKLSTRRANQLCSQKQTSKDGCNTAHHTESNFNRFDTGTWGTSSAEWPAGDDFSGHDGTENGADNSFNWRSPPSCRSRRWLNPSPSGSRFHSADSGRAGDRSRWSPSRRCHSRGSWNLSARGHDGSRSRRGADNGGCGGNYSGRRSEWILGGGHRSLSSSHSCGDNWSLGGSGISGGRRSLSGCGISGGDLSKSNRTKQNNS